MIMGVTAPRCEVCQAPIEMHSAGPGVNVKAPLASDALNCWTGGWVRWGVGFPARFETDEEEDLK